MKTERQKFDYYAEERLLLLSARQRWSPEQLTLAKELAPRVRQWDMFVNVANEKFVSQMTYENIASIADSLIPEVALAKLHVNAISEAVNVMSKHAALDWFHNNCVMESGIDYAYFKGPAIAARFFVDSSKRFFRDIDILVPARQRFDFLRVAIAKGCRVFVGSGQTFRYLDFQSAEDLRDFNIFVKVPHLLTPQGLVVEVHREIDNHTYRFLTEVLLATRSEVKLYNNSLKIVSDTNHIIFSCYHHTRHYWSKLNWLADIDAFMSSSGLDNSSLLSHADAIGLKSTVEAVLELHELTCLGRHPEDFDYSTPGIDLLSACIKNLAGGKEIEVELRRGQRWGVLGFHWQKTRLSFLSRSGLFFRRFSPNYEDILTLRWAGPFRYPFASVMKICRALYRRVRSFVRP